MFFDAVLFAEAAQNAAAYTNIRVAAGSESLGYLYGSDTDYLKVRSGLGKPFILGAWGISDSADTQGFRFVCNSFGTYTPRWKKYGVEAVARNFLDLRQNPIPMEAGDELRAQFYEDKSTNVEAAVLALIGYQSFGLDAYFQERRARQYDQVLIVDVTMSSTTAATISGGDKTLGDGTDGKLLADRYYDVLGYAGSIPSADGKACFLKHQEWPTVPGFVVPSTDLGQLNYSPMDVLPRPLPFKGDNPPQVWTYDITGSTTPTHSFVIGQYGKGKTPGAR